MEELILLLYFVNLVGLAGIVYGALDEVFNYEPIPLHITQDSKDLRAIPRLLIIATWYIVSLYYNIGRYIIKILKYLTFTGNKNDN